MFFLILSLSISLWQQVIMPLCCCIFCHLQTLVPSLSYSSIIGCNAKVLKRSLQKHGFSRLWNSSVSGSYEVERSQESYKGVGKKEKISTKAKISSIRQQLKEIHVTLLRTLILSILNGKHQRSYK